MYSGGCYYFNSTTEEWEGTGIVVSKKYNIPIAPKKVYYKVISKYKAHLKTMFLGILDVHFYYSIIL